MKLALGTVQFGLPYGVSNNNGQTPLDEAQKILELAHNSGISLLDTAMAYGDSEARLGKIGVESFRVLTKLPSLPENCTNPKKWAEEQVDGSLQRLGLKCLYGLLLHNPAQLLTSSGHHLFEALQGLKTRGLVEKIGISIYAPSELDELLKLFSFDIVQSPFNPVDRSLLTSGWMNKLHAQGIEIHVRSIFLQGLLLMTQNQVPSKFSRWSPLWKNWLTWLYQNGISPQAACLAFAKSQPEINQILVGVETRHQLEQILDAFHSSTPESFPSIESTDPDLINPTQWSKL